MPLVNLYTDKNRVKALEKIFPEFREYAAKALSCKSITLDSREISLKVFVPEASMRLADTEVRIDAHSFPERVKKQDEISLSIKNYLESICARAGSVYVWLRLSELGHSGE